MTTDLIGVFLAFFLFPLFVCIPGYVVGWFLDAFGFRQRSFPARVVLSLPLSIGISPALAYLLWHVSAGLGWATFGFISVIFVGLLFRERRTTLFGLHLSKTKLAIAALGVGWIVLSTFCLIDLQYGDRLYFSLVAYDYTLRSAVTAAITRSGIPPFNPYFFPGKPVLLRYHYFWFILCSLVQQLGRGIVSPRQAVMAGTIWSGLGMMAVIPVYLRFLQPKQHVNLEKRTLIGIALLSVTGLDILPITLIDVFSRRLFPSVEWWNTAVVAWSGSMLWVPHNVAALVACLMGFALVSCEPAQHTAARKGLTSIAAGMVFASSVGLAVYISLVSAAFMAIWMAALTIKKQYKNVGLLCIAGFAAVVFSTPYMLETLGGIAGQSATGGAFLQLAIRPFRLAEFAFGSTAVVKNWYVTITNAILLPLNYFLELGFFFFVGAEYLKKILTSQRPWHSKEFFSMLLLAVSMSMCTFLRSGTLSNNDLEMRGVMFAQFVLLIWGAELISEGLLSRPVFLAATNHGLSRRKKHLLYATLVLGVAGTFYDVFMLRWFPVIQDNTNVPKYKWLASDHNLGTRTYALRQLYRQLGRILPINAIVQHNPDILPGDLPYGLYADRQAAVETPGCGTVFGGDTESCQRMIGPVISLFEDPEVTDSAQAIKVCRDLKIDALVVKDTDPVWANDKSWIWRTNPFLSNKFARVFLCGQMIVQQGR